MKKDQSTLLTSDHLDQLRHVGACLARLRLARRVRQSDAAVRAGIARSTAALIEKGSPSVAFGQVIRYLDAIAPHMPLLHLLNDDEQAAKLTAYDTRPERARGLSKAELAALDF
jgi:transcriptional regulator with XRE-family HTH domain